MLLLQAYWERELCTRLTGMLALNDHTIGGMEMKKRFLSKSPSVTLAIFLLFFGGFYLLIQLCGYTFVPVNSYVTNLISAVIIVWVTVRRFKNKNEKTKAAIVCTVLLPLIAVFFVTAKGFVTDLSNAGTFLYVAHSGLTLVCGMVLFFLGQYGKSVKIG